MQQRCAALVMGPPSPVVPLSRVIQCFNGLTTAKTEKPMLRVLLQLLLVGGLFVSAFDYPRPCSQTSCQPGKCVWENCDEALECEGGMCKFTNCRNARCAGMYIPRLL